MAPKPAGRPPAAPADRPVRILRPEIRLYQHEPELIAYFDQFPVRSQPTAIKRAIRAAISGGGLGLGAQPIAAVDDTLDLDEFVG